MKRYISKLLYVLPAKKSSLILLLSLFILVSMMEAFGIGLIGPFINLASNPESLFKNDFINWIYIQTGSIGQNKFIALIGLFIIIIFGIKSYLSWRVQTYVFTFSYQQETALTNKMLHTYLNAPYTFHLEKSSNYIIHNTFAESKSISNTILIPLLTSISNLIISSALILLLSFTNIFIVIAVLGGFLPIFLIFNSFKDRIKLWGKQGSQSNERMLKIVNHSLGGIKETKLIGCAPYFEQQMIEEQHIYLKSTISFFGFKLLPRITIELLLFLFLIGFTSIFLLLNQNIEELTATLSVFALASIRLIPAFSNLLTGISTLRKSTFGLNKLYFDLKEQENIKRNKAARFSYSDYRQVSQQLNFAKEIILESVTYPYPNAKENALNGISMTIPKGQSIALIGKSGAGKTTLVDVILGLLIPQNSDIKVDGKSIYTDLRSWQNMIGYILQSIFLIDDTIEKNIAFGIPEDSINRERVNKAIKAAQLEELVERLPEGTQTMVGERGVLLSGGQRQRIGIARALYHEREVLVLDEATAALDNETESLITQAMQSLSGSKTLIIIAHRLTTVQHCDCIYMMEKGKIVKSGTYQEVVLGAQNTVEPKA